MQQQDRAIERALQRDRLGTDDDPIRTDRASLETRALDATPNVGPQRTGNKNNEAETDEYERHAANISSKLSAGCKRIFAGESVECVVNAGLSRLS